MKKKVKKIPKFNGGTGSVNPYDLTTINNIVAEMKAKAASVQNNGASASTAGTIASGKEWADMNKTQRTGAIVDAAAALGQGINVTTSGQDVNFGTALSTATSMATAGATIGGPIGAGIGFGVGTIMGTAGRSAGYNANSASTNFNEIYNPGKGWLSWFDADNKAKRMANMVQSSNIAKARTEDLKADYANQGINPAPNVLAAEGGIMRQPVDALVSKGELIYNPVTKKLSQVPGSKGKPNKADDVYAKLYEGDVVISNSPTMLMANGKTPAQNLMGMVDKYSTGGTVKAREAIIKKVVNWQEANKTKPQEYAKFDGGGVAGINKYGYNKNMSDFAYWDKDKNEYKKEYLDWVNKLTEQDVRDIEAGKYGDMSEYFSKNKGKKLDVATAQKLMTDKKYGNWHKIGKAVVDKKTKAEKETPLAETPIKMNITGVDSAMWQNKYAGKYPIDYTVTPPDMNLKRLPNPSQADGIIAANRTLKKAARNAKLNSIGEAISDFAPLATALFGDYDWHTEQPQISPAKYVPTGVSIEPIRRAANESYAMARYNQENISPNTGVGMAYGLQAAANRAKTLADAYTWQQDAQNKLIAQNAGIYNDWAKRFDAARYQAIADTRANEGAAQQMKDSAIRDALEFTQGRRNDKILADMMKPIFEYGTPNEAYERIYKRRIV